MHLCGVVGSVRVGAGYREEHEIGCPKRSATCFMLLSIRSAPQQLVSLIEDCPGRNPFKAYVVAVAGGPSVVVCGEAG